MGAGNRARQIKSRDDGSSFLQQSPSRQDTRSQLELVQGTRHLRLQEDRQGLSYSSFKRASLFPVSPSPAAAHRHGLQLPKCQVAQ